MSVFASVSSEPLCICSPRTLGRVEEKGRRCLICARSDMMTQGQEERGVTQKRPCSSRQTRPAATKLPGTEKELCFAQSKYPRAFVAFAAELSFIVHPRKMTHRLGNGDQEAHACARLPFLAQCLVGRLAGTLHHSSHRERVLD